MAHPAGSSAQGGRVGRGHLAVSRTPGTTTRGTGHQHTAADEHTGAHIAGTAARLRPTNRSSQMWAGCGLLRGEAASTQVNRRFELYYDPSPPSASLPQRVNFFERAESGSRLSPRDGGDHRPLPAQGGAWKAVVSQSRVAAAHPARIRHRHVQCCNPIDSPRATESARQSRDRGGVAVPPSHESRTARSPAT